MNKSIIEIRVGGRGFETAQLGGTAVIYEAVEKRMLALGCPAELANGSVFERLAAEVRSGKRPSRNMPLGSTGVTDVDAVHRSIAERFADEIDADNRRRADAWKHIIAADGH